MAKIIIKDADDLRNIRTRIRSLKVQMYQFQSVTIRKLANSILVDTIQKRMREANYSEKIVINTILTDVEFITKTKLRLYFKSELFTETGFDIALVREKTGTKDHMVRPSVKKALKWIDNGVARFSRGHQVSGIKALHIINKTLKELRGTLQVRYDQELQHWISSNLKGEGINSIR